VSYRELGARACRFARALLRRNLAPGDRVAIFSGNTIDMVVAFWGTLVAGGVAVPIGACTRTEKLAWLLDHCGAAALVTERRLSSVYAEALASTKRPCTVFVSGLAAHEPTDFATALAEADSDEPSAGDHAPDALAAILYTSGSTGRPKGVMLTHASMVAATGSISQYLGLREDDVIQCLLPMSFDYGLYQCLLSAHRGCRLVLAPPLTLPGQVLKQAAAERVTFFPGVPTVFALLGELGEVSRWDLSSVRAVSSTGAALTAGHIAIIRRVFPAARIFSMYGVTECKRCSYLPPEDLARKPGSVGIAIPHTELWLVDERDRRLGPNQVGQIVVRGPTVMRGYWADPDATARALRPGPLPGERVLYTGDLGRLDDEGYLYFVARTDDVIKSGGEKVAPKEVELVLAEIPGVKEVAVVGVPDAFLGHAVKAFVVLGAPLRESDLLRVCRSKLESFMVPRSIAIVASLPKNANGKIDKPVLLAAAGHAQGGGGACDHS
jgi:amino acid adenylation domain-containing protein